MSNRPFLSICIPTYNRASYLKNTLESIVSQPEFLNSDDVEIIISDNATPIGTKELCEEYVKKYKNKIFYSRNETTKHSSENFKKVFSLAHGDFLKLHNDTLMIKPNGLTKLLETVKKYKDTKPLIFFSPTVKDEKASNNLSDFITNASFYTTWIGGFCLWKEQSEYFDMFVTKRDCRLAQTYILCDIVAKTERSVVVSSDILENQSVKNKGTGDEYNIAEVFGHNYLTILKEFVEKKKLSQKVYEKEKKNILLKHINHFYFDLKHQYAFTKDGYFKWLLPDYKYNLYFYIAYIKIMFLHLSKIILKPLAWVFSVYSKKKKGYKLKILHILGIKIVIKKKKLK